MGHFYFVRHGQTVWNVENKICGATDIALTEFGHQQAIETGKKILKEGIKVDEILYSPLIRAADTAKHISEITGIPARMEPRLTEQRFGKWESTPRDGEAFKKAKEFFAYSHEGGESTLRLSQRIYNLLDDIREESDQKTYILVAHNGIARVVQSYFYDMTNEEYAAFGVKNCEIVRYDFDKPAYRFYGWEQANVAPVSEAYRNIRNPRELYDILSNIWCAKTCAPRMRDKWSEDNKTLGQCSITAFLAQDIFGGKVYGIQRPGGNYHCYNVVGDCCFDLTSEQFGGEVLDYQDNPEQFREVHFQKEEKRKRYEYLKGALEQYAIGTDKTAL